MNGPGAVSPALVPTDYEGVDMPDRTCSIEGCENSGKMSRGWCSTHYNRWWKHGDPLGGKSRGENYRWLQDAIAVPTDECIVWPFNRTTRGLYGSIKIAGRQGRVTHVALELAGFPRPAAPRNNALHSCDNPPCVNPRHLRWGTTAENSADMNARGRRNDAMGERHGQAKLTAEKVADIRSRDYSEWGSKAATAREFGISHQHLSALVLGECWPSVS